MARGDFTVQWRTSWASTVFGGATNKGRNSSSLTDFPEGMKAVLYELLSGFDLDSSLPASPLTRFWLWESTNRRVASQTSCFFPGTISGANSQVSLLWMLILLIFSPLLNNTHTLTQGKIPVCKPQHCRPRWLNIFSAQTLGLPGFSCSNKCWLSDLRGIHRGLCFAAVIQKYELIYLAPSCLTWNLLLASRMEKVWVEGWNIPDSGKH